jgi:hypothetical protein
MTLDQQALHDRRRPQAASAGSIRHHRPAVSKNESTSAERQQEIANYEAPSYA